MKILKNIFMFSLLIIIYFIGCKNIYAANLSITNTDVYFTRDLSNGKRFSEKMQYYSFNDVPAYCIEPGIKAGSNQYKSKSINDLEYSEEVKERIKKIAYYGYKYPGHEDIKYYYAAQGLIWQTILGLTNTPVFSTLPFDKGIHIDIRNEINEINSLVDKHNLVPKFNETINLKIGDTSEYEDINNVLNNFNYDISDNSIVNISKDNNKLIIKGLKKGSTSIKFYKDKVYTSNYRVYIADCYQNMYRVGNISLKSNTLKINVYGGSIKISKVDSDDKTFNKNLIGTKYNLYDINNNLIKELSVNSKGIIYLDNLDIGSYYVQESVSSKMYNKDINKYYFDINLDNPNVNLILEDEIIKGNIKILKIDKDTNDLLSDVCFTLTDENNNKVAYGCTDNEGILTFNNIKYGNYLLKETKAKEGYKLDNNIYKVNINKDKEEINLNIKNEKIYEKVVINNVPNTHKISIYQIFIIIVFLGISYYALKKI